MARPAAVLDILVNAQTGKASAELKKFERNLKSTERQAGDTDKQIVSSDKNVKSFGGSVGEANQRVLGLKNAVGLVKFPAFIAGAGAAAQAVGALGAGAVGLTSALAPLSGLLAAYPALLGAMGQAAGVKALAGFDKLGSAVGGLNEKLDETTTEFKALSPEAQKFARSLNQAKGPVRDLQAAVQKPLFKGLNEGIDAAMENFPALQKVLKGTAGEMGRLAKEAGELVGSKGFGKDFESIGKNNTQLLGRLGDAGLNFANALRHVMVAAEPLIDFLGKGVVRFSEWIEAEAKAGRESGRMAEFFERTEKVVRQLVSIGGSLASAFLDIGHAARPLGESILKTLVQQARALSEWTSSNQGTLKAYFEDAKGPLAEAGKLVKDIVAGFFDLSQQKGLGSFISQIRKELLPAVLEMTKATTKQFGPVLIETLVELTKLLTNFVGSSGTLTLFVKMIGTAAEALNKLFESIPGLATAASSALAGFSIFKLLGLGGLTGAGAKGGLMTKIGTQLGTRFGTTFANAAGPVAAGLFASALAGAQVGKALDIGQSKIGEKIAEELDIGLKKAMQVEQWMKNHPGLSAPEAFDAMRDAAREARKDVLDDIDLLRNRWGASLQEIKQRTQQNMQGIRQTMGENSMKARIAVMNNFDAAVDAIKASMKAGETSANEGARAIHRILIKQLKSYGISDPEGFLATTEGKKSRDTSGTPSPGGKQKGGMVPGYGSGDKVPLHIGGQMAAMVEPGEYVSVANKRATAALMAANNAVPRFAAGGLVQALGPYDIPPIQADDNHGALGYNSHLHLSMESVALAKALAAKIKPLGWTASEAPWAGGVTVSHQDPGHYTGSAFDANTAADETRAEVAQVAKILGGGVAGAVGGAVAQALKLELPRFTGTNGLGGMVAQGLNNSAAAIEQVIGKRASKRMAVDDGAQGAISGDGNVERVFAQVAKKLSTSKTATLALGMAGYAESGMRDLSYGDASSQGALQLLASTAAGLGINPHDEGAISSHFLLKGYYGKGGANALAASGLPAHLVAQNVQGSATPSGSNYADQRGPAQAWMQHFGLKKGGVLMLGDSLGVGMKKAAGFPGGWTDYVADSKTSGWGLQQLGKLSDQGSVMFEFGTNDANNGDVSGFKSNLGKAIRSAHGKGAGLAAMTVAGVKNASGVNRAIGSSGVDAVADWAGVASRYGADPHTDASGYRAMQKLVKAAAGKAKGAGGDDTRGQGGIVPIGGGPLEGIYSDPFEGGQSYTPADVPKKIMDMITAHQGAVKLLKTEIMLAEHFASYNSSEAGASEGPLEVAKQLFLNQQLLTNLEGIVTWAKRGLGLKRTSKKGKGILSGILAPLIGDGENIGEILNVKKRIDDLMHPEFSTELTEGQQFGIEYWKEQTRKANLRTAVSQAQYDVFKNFAGGFAEGGYIPGGKWGVVGEAGPEVISGPNTITPMGGEGVSVIVNGDIINTPPGMQPVEVRGAKTIVQQGSRGYGRRPLGGAKGY